MFKAKHIMKPEVLAVRADDTIDKAMALMLEHAIAGLPVVDEAGNVAGVVSEFDLLDLVCDCWPLQDKVSHYMSAEACVVDQDTDWLGVAELFRASALRVVPVTCQGRLVGVISRFSLLQTILNARRLVRDVLAEVPGENDAGPDRTDAGNHDSGSPRCSLS